MFLDFMYLALCRLFFLGQKVSKVNFVHYGVNKREWSSWTISLSIIVA